MQTMTKPTLEVGDLVEVHGYPLLAKLNPGRYRIKSISTFYGRRVVSFSLPGGKRTIVTHLEDSVRAWMRSADNPDINKIVKL